MNSSAVADPAPIRALPDTSAGRAWELLEQAARRTSAVVLGRVAQVDGPGGRRIHSLEETELLYRLAASAAGQERIGDLESVIIRDKNKITRLVDRLEAAKLVTRRPSSSDRRVTFISLTPAGRDTLIAIGPAWGAGLGECLADRVSPADIDVASNRLKVLLSRALDSLQTRFGDGDTGDDADAWALPQLQRLADGWRSDNSGATSQHVVFWIRLLRVAAVFDDALERGQQGRHGLSLSKADLLLAVAHAPDGRVPLSSLAAATNVTSGGVTRIVDRLQGRGLVRRVPHPTDRRSALVELTPTGSELAMNAGDTRREVITAGLERVLTSAELDELAAVLQRIVEPGTPSIRPEPVRP